MKQQKPQKKNKKVKALSKTKGWHRKPGAMTTSWGRGASEYRPGIFIRNYLSQYGEGCAADIFYDLKLELKRINTERVEIGDVAIRGGTYNSFAKYFFWFRLLGLVESVHRQEPAVYDFLKPKQFYKLTTKGMDEEIAWEDPVRAAHPEYQQILI